MFKLYNKDYSNLIVKSDKLKTLRISNFTNVRKALTVQELAKLSGLSLPTISNLEKLDSNGTKLTDILKYLQGCQFDRVRLVILDGNKRKSPPLLAIPSLRKLKKITQKEHYELLNVSRKDLIALELDMVELQKSLITKDNYILLKDITDNELKLSDIIIYLGVIGYPLTLEIDKF